MVKKIHGGNKSVALFSAIEKNDTKQALYLIDGMTPDEIGAKNEIGSSTALIEACSKGMEDVALALIKTNASNPEYIDSYGRSALDKAVSNRMNVALKIIEKMENKDIVNQKQLLIKVCSYRMDNVALKIIEILKESTSTSIIGNKNDEGDTALIIACYNGMQEVALALIEILKNSKDISIIGATDKQGNTALNIACSKGMKEVALALIETGGESSKPGNVNKYGRTALVEACSKGMKEVASALIETGESKPEYVCLDKTTALLLSIKNDMKDIALAIIQKIMDSDSIRDSKDIQKRKSFGITNSEGNTALMLACKKHLQDVVLALIETGESNLEAINKYDETALSIACEENLDVKQQIMDKINERKSAEKKVACPELKNLLELDENNEKKFVFKFIQNTKHTYRTPAHWEKVDESYFDEKMQNDVYRKCSGEIIVEHFKERLKDNDVVIFKNTDEALGVCVFHMTELKDKKETVKVLFIDILCAKNKYYKNVGKLLMNEMIELIKENKINIIELEPVKNAIGFYQKMGFVWGKPFKDKKGFPIQHMYYIVKTASKDDTIGGHYYSKSKSKRKHKGLKHKTKKQKTKG